MSTDPELLTATNIAEGDVLFVVATDTTDAERAQMQAQLDEHFKERGVLALVSATPIDMITMKPPKADELLWVCVEEASQTDVDMFQTVLEEFLPRGEGVTLVSNFTPDINLMRREELQELRQVADVLEKHFGEPRATINLVYPAFSVENPAWVRQSRKENAFIEAVRDLAAEKLLELGHEVPENLIDLVVEFLMACERPPTESKDIPATVYVEEPDGEQRPLGTATTWRWTESRDVTRRMEGDRVTAIEPVPGSARVTLVLEGFKPTETP